MFETGMKCEPGPQAPRSPCHQGSRAILQTQAWKVAPSRGSSLCTFKSGYYTEGTHTTTTWLEALATLL